jgi:hypothetical protein
VGICIGAAVNLPHGTLKTVAIVVSVLNGLTTIGMAREVGDNVVTGGANFLTAVMGLGLLVYSIRRPSVVTIFVTTLPAGALSSGRVGTKKPLASRVFL